MVLQIRTTGVEDYIDGSANIKMLCIGGPGVGKTRSSSFWPRPIYGDCESGRGSIADRKVPYAEIKSSQDMLDFLAHLKGLERIPKAERQFQTVVIDTLDGFQRKVKNEWMEQTKAASFKGFEAWGYLDTKMSALMTRLLNLDYNIVVLVHYKDKVVRDGDAETHELMLQLQGEIKDTAFNDFDLVGWLGTFWHAEEGERVEKRGLTFEKTPARPFLKDRYGVMPKWVPITFTDDDYGQLYDAFLSRVDSLPESEDIGQIESAAPEMNPHVVPPSAPQGALPPVDPKDIPLHQFDKPTLARMCREADPPITTTVDGVPIKGNTIKGELIAAIELHRLNAARNLETDATSASEPATPDATGSDAALASPPEPTPEAANAPDVEPTPVPPADLVETPDAGVVNKTTGEITQDQAVALVAGELGGEVVSEIVAAETPAPAAEPATPPICALPECEEVLGVQAGFSSYKYHVAYCDTHYKKAKSMGLGPSGHPDPRVLEA